MSKHCIAMRKRALHGQVDHVCRYRSNETRFAREFDFLYDGGRIFKSYFYKTTNRELK